MKLWVRSKLPGGYIKGGHRYGENWESVDADEQLEQLLAGVPLALEVAHKDPNSAAKKFFEPEETDPGPPPQPPAKSKKKGK